MTIRRLRHIAGRDPVALQPGNRIPICFKRADALDLQPPTDDVNLTNHDIRGSGAVPQIVESCATSMLLNLVTAGRTQPPTPVSMESGVTTGATKGRNRPARLGGTITNVVCADLLEHRVCVTAGCDGGPSASTCSGQEQRRAEGWRLLNSGLFATDLDPRGCKKLGGSRRANEPPPSRSQSSSMAANRRRTSTFTVLSTTPR